MSLIKSDKEIQLLRQGGKFLNQVMSTVAKTVKPGVNTAELDATAEKMITDFGGRPAFKGYGSPPYPASLCTSVNDELVHSIPAPEVELKSGDIISLDLGMQYPAKDGLYTDMAVTVPVGKISKEAKKLLAVTRQALDIVAKNLRPGIDLQVIARLVQEHIEKHDFSVVRALVGHGVGHAVHEEPQIPNFVIPNYHFEVQKGMVLAFEPMVSVGHRAVKTLDDKWTVKMADGSLAAHFEHTIAVTETGNEILTRP
jgi:methionyl aminopeptidase